MYFDLKILRKKINLTQKEIAKILSVSQSTISKYEKTFNVSEEIYNKILIKFKNEISEKDQKKNNFNEEEIEGYQLMRDLIKPYSRIASINRVLIELNQAITKASIQIETLTSDSEFKKIKHKVKAPIKTTTKFLKKILKDLEEINNNDFIEIEEENKNGF
ncbi:helix-turn-helix domain-containing protein [Fusobacterium nucleatum]|uniref:helix-turn-helix domain-containing protein n=1 Tax=Fusobacterium nucleatum TaxID=851 RepID=UPI0030D58D0D